MTRIRDFVLLNLFFFLFLSVVLSFIQGGVFLSTVLPITGAMIIAIAFAAKSEYAVPVKVELLQQSLVFHFVFGESKKYALSEIKKYASAAYGNGKSGFNHGLVFEFNDGYRTVVTDRFILNYNDFLGQIEASELEYFGYIGVNNWRRKSKPLKLWKTFTNEEEQLKAKIGKTPGRFFEYFGAFIVFAMNLLLLWVVLFVQ